MNYSKRQEFTPVEQIITPASILKSQSYENEPPKLNIERLYTLLIIIIILLTIILMFVFTLTLKSLFYNK